MSQEIEVLENVMERNRRLAEKVNADLTARGVFAVNVMGSPGSGKTSTLLGLIPALRPVASFVIEGDIQSDIDTRKLSAAGIPAVQINTGGACHLDSPLIANVIPNDLSGFLFIENIGNLVCPAEFMIGEHIKLLVANVAEGSDKPYKYPLAFEKADAIVLNKVDLLPHVDFDPEYFTTGVRRLNASAPIFHTSGKTGEGIDKVAAWLGQRSAKQSS